MFATATLPTNLSEQNLFNYETDRPRCWRPDLVPAILSWIESLSADAERDLHSFTVERFGGFGAEFHVRPARGGERRLVVHRFDHTFHKITTDVGYWGAPLGPIPFKNDQLLEPANYF